MFCDVRRVVEWEGGRGGTRGRSADLVVRRRPVERSSHRCESPTAWQPSSSQGGGGRGKGRPTFWNLETSPPSAFPIQLSTLQLQTERRGKDSWTLQLNFPIWKSNIESYLALKCNDLTSFSLKTCFLQNIVFPQNLDCVKLVLDLVCLTIYCAASTSSSTQDGGRRILKPPSLSLSLFCKGWSCAAWQLFQSKILKFKNSRGFASPPLLQLLVNTVRTVWAANSEKLTMMRWCNVRAQMFHSSVCIRCIMYIK